MKKKRNEFESSVRKQVEAGEHAWDAAKLRLAIELKGFEAETKKYLETFGNGMEQQQAVFQSQVTAQLNAWCERRTSSMPSAKEFAIERRREIDATVSRMKTDAAGAEKKLQELARAGRILLDPQHRPAETRATFDRANQANTGGVQTGYQFGSIAVRRPTQPSSRRPSERLAPVIWAASSLHRNSASEAICSTVTNSLVGWAASRTSLIT